MPAAVRERDDRYSTGTDAAAAAAARDVKLTKGLAVLLLSLMAGDSVTIELTQHVHAGDIQPAAATVTTTLENGCV